MTCAKYGTVPVTNNDLAGLSGHHIQQCYNMHQSNLLFVFIFRLAMMNLDCMMKVVEKFKIGLFNKVWPNLIWVLNILNKKWRRQQ